MRQQLLLAAGLTPERTASLTKKSLAVRERLLDATKSEFFSWQGEVKDERIVPDLKVQLEAAKQLDQVLGLNAPPARASVTVVHRVELPEWMLPDHATTRVIDVEDAVVEE